MITTRSAITFDVGRVVIDIDRKDAAVLEGIIRALPAPRDERAMLLAITRPDYDVLYKLLTSFDGVLV